MHLFKRWRGKLFFYLFSTYFAVVSVRSAHKGDEKTVMMYIWFGSRVRLNDREYEAPQKAVDL